MIFDYVLQFAVSVVATVAFAVLFEAPKKHCPFCGLVGGIAWIVNLLCQANGMSAAIACFFAALILTMTARFGSFFFKTPIIIFLIPGIFPLVPGAGIYYTAYYLILGDSAMAGMKGMATLMAAGSISLGILFAFSLPQAFFQKAANALRRKG